MTFCQETFPIDPVISEAFTHATGLVSCSLVLLREHRPLLLAGNVAAVFLILIGNVMHWEPTQRINKHQVCNDGTDVSVKAWDYSPFYYLIMVGAVGIAVGFIFLVNPRFRRLNIDSKETLETTE